MKIFCLIAFVFLATSFTTNNENFEKVSNSEGLGVKKPMEEYRVNAYQQSYSSGSLAWEKVPIKISVTSSYVGENITVIEVYNNRLNKWDSVNSLSYRVQKTYASFDGESIASQFAYKAGSLYFNF